MPSAATTVGPVAPTAPAAGGKSGGCQPFGPPERIELGPDGWFSASAGLAVRFEGTSHDSLEDGRSAMMLKLTLWDTNGSTGWLPDVNAAPRFVPLMGRCVRLLEGADKRAVIEIAPARKPGAPATAAPAVSKCGPPARGVPLLKDYTTVEDGTRYHVVVERSDQGEWFATPMPRMLRHFSSRIDWTNLIDYPQLARATSGQLRFTFELLSRTVHHYPSQHRWSAAYRARVDEICRP